MILAKEIVAVSTDGTKFVVPAFVEIKDINPAKDKGYWFSYTIFSYGKTVYKRAWAEFVPILRD